MKKIKLTLNESLITNTNSNQIDVIEDVVTQQKPDYQIIDVTVIPDEEYNPTIQSILIDLDESNRLCESAEESKNLSINILSETVNIKTGYSNSLFEFENMDHTITLSLVLQETERKGVYRVEAYTTKGEKVFESNTYKPKKLIESYLNSLANEYLIDKSLKEGYSLGDDKESFKIWDKENEKLKKIYDYVTAGSRKDLEEVMKTLEHSQDSIYHADVTIKGLKEEDLDKEDELYSLMQKYPFIDNIQITKWYGDEVVCFIGFDIEGAYSDRRLDVAIRTCLETLFGADYLNYPNSLNEAEDPIKDDVKNDLGIEPGSDEETQLEDLYYDDEEEDKYYGAEDTPFEDGPKGDKFDNNYSVEEFMDAMKLTDEVKNLNIDYSEWNNMGQEERDKLVTPELNRFYNKYKVEFDKDPKLFELLQYNLTDDNFHTEARILRDLKGGE